MGLSRAVSVINGDFAQIIRDFLLPTFHVLNAATEGALRISIFVKFESTALG